MNKHFQQIYLDYLLLDRLVNYKSNKLVTYKMIWTDGMNQEPRIYKLGQGIEREEFCYKSNTIGV